MPWTIHFLSVLIFICHVNNIMKNHPELLLWVVHIHNKLLSVWGLKWTLLVVVLFGIWLISLYLMTYHVPLRVSHERAHSPSRSWRTASVLLTLWVLLFWGTGSLSALIPFPFHHGGCSPQHDLQRLRHQLFSWCSSFLL